MTLRTTNPKQFVIEILGLRKPSLGEVFEIEVPPYRARVEVECVEREGSLALVERTDDGPKIEGVRSRVISDRKVPPPDLKDAREIYAMAQMAVSTEEILQRLAAERDYEAFQRQQSQDYDYDEYSELP